MSLFVEPPKDLMGGPWYSDQEFDVAFVDTASRLISIILSEEV